MRLQSNLTINFSFTKCSLSELTWCQFVCITVAQRPRNTWSTPWNACDTTCKDAERWDIDQLASCVNYAALYSFMRHMRGPGPALVTGSGKNTVSTGHTGFLLSQPQGAFVSRWRASLDWGGGITTSTTVRFLFTPDRSTNPAQHHQRPIISCDCRTCMEQSSYQHHSINLFAIFQETT